MNVTTTYRAIKAENGDIKTAFTDNAQLVEWLSNDGYRVTAKTEGN